MTEQAREQAGAVDDLPDTVDFGIGHGRVYVATYPEMDGLVCMESGELTEVGAAVLREGLRLFNGRAAANADRERLAQQVSDPHDGLTIARMSGYEDGKRAALARAQAAEGLLGEAHTLLRNQGQGTVLEGRIATHLAAHATGSGGAE